MSYQLDERALQHAIKAQLYKN